MASKGSRAIRERKRRRATPSLGLSAEAARCPDVGEALLCSLAIPTKAEKLLSTFVAFHSVGPRRRPPTSGVDVFGIGL